MPPYNETGAEGVEQYHLFESTLNNSISLGKMGLSKVKSATWTPSLVNSVIDKAEGAVSDYVVERYAVAATNLVNKIDARLDSAVIAPAVSACHEASERADQIITTTESRLDKVRNQMGFVSSSIKESCGSAEEDIEDEECEQQPSLVRRAKDKVSSMRSIVQANYYKVLENADHGIEVYLIETDEDAEPVKAETPIALCMKAVKRMKPTASKRLAELELKARTTEQLQQLVHVDLISYAAKVIDTTAAASFHVAVKQPLALKAKASTSAEEIRVKAAASAEAAREVVLAKATVAKDTAAETLATAKGKVLLKVLPLLEHHYPTAVVEAYTAALARATEKRDTILILLQSSKTYVADKCVLIYNDGTQGFIVELREQGFLPADGKATLASAMVLAHATPQELHTRADTLATELLLLAHNSPELAKQKLADLHTMAVSAMRNVQTQAPVIYEQARVFSEEQSAKIMKLSKTAHELAHGKIKELYTWFLTLSPEVQTQLESAVLVAKSIPTKAQALAASLPEALPVLKAKWELACTKFETDVKPMIVEQLNRLKVSERWEALKNKAQVLESQYKPLVLQQMSKLQVAERWAAVKATGAEIQQQAMHIWNQAVNVIAQKFGKAQEPTKAKACCTFQCSLQREQFEGEKALLQSEKEAMSSQLESLKQATNSAP